MFKLSFKQQVLTGFAVSLLFVLISAVTSYLSVKSLDDSSYWQNHTYEVINLTQKIETELLNAESGLRGFIITQKADYIDPYNKNESKIIPNIIALKKLVSDNPPQLEKADSLEFYAEKKLVDMHEILQANASSGQDLAFRKVMTDKGKFYKDRMLHFVTSIIAVEMKLLKERQERASGSSTRTIVVVLASAFIIFCLILFLFSYIKRTFDEQKLTEIKIRENNEQLAKVSLENEQKNWMLSGGSAINESLRGEQEIDELCNHVVSTMCNYMNAPVGALYLLNSKKQSLILTGSYAFEKKGKSREIMVGEGLVGQVALEKRILQLNDIPADYVKVNSSLGNMPPNTLVILPVLFEDEIIAVMELGLPGPPTAMVLDFFTRITVNIGIGINSARARAQLRDLFLQTQQQAEELESQQEELRTTNEELIYKSEQLQASEEELRVQQEELRQTNAELEEKAQQLEERNISINQAKEAISMKAEELEVSSKYKSEFLANMSHELRTPLNSILILARILKENKPENLTEDQLKYAGVIHNAGSDLLTLINDILDLSKIESGTIDLHIETVRPAELTQNMESLFTEIARSKKIKFKTLLAEDLPATINTDLARIEQVIKNLLSNAFKFTPEHGEIALKISKAPQGHTWFSDQLKTTAREIISFSVKDSGIGIPEDKQKLIFEAFQQADGSTSRKYGGTGLGLSISKELAYILGGEIQVESTPGEGSTFTLFIPANHTLASAIQEAAIVQQDKFIPAYPEPLSSPAAKGEALTLLIVEDDITFAEVLRDYALEKGFQPMLAYSGDTGLQMAEDHLPDAIVLDIMLPVMDGWTILKKLKNNPKTKHIPVHMMSAGEEKTAKAQQEGAIGFLKKPIEKEQLDQAFNLLGTAQERYDFKTVLIIEDQELQSQLVKEQLLHKDVEVEQAFNGGDALEILKFKRFDCIILDLNLPDISGFDLLDQIKTQPELAHIPVIINTAMELDQHKMAHIMKYTEAMVLKSNKSNDRLIDEVSLFMNKLKKEEEALNSAHQKVKPKNGAPIEKVLADKTILIADDDMRNIFALSSALQAYDMNIVIANNGREALEKLEEATPVDLVLMDIMMPEMDGYEAMRNIRLKKEFAKLPIIALTAKAMKNDREKCIEAGANDYISKPVDIDKLLSMMRVWLS